MNRILTTIRQRYPAMTPVEKRIADAILHSPKQAADETITHLAARAGTSSGSVANFATSLGLRGFSDLKIRIAQSLENFPTPAFDGVCASDDPRQAMQKMICSAQAAFAETLENMQEELTAAARLFMEARRIEIYASGSSLPVAHDIHYRLIRLGLPAVIVPDPLLASMSASQLTSQDVVVAVSHKGRTTNTLSSVQTAKQRSAKIIALTSYQTSPLTELSDVCLLSLSSEAQEDREAVVSRLTQLLIMDSLCAYIAAQRGHEAMRRLDREIEVLEKHRKPEKLPSL